MLKSITRSITWALLAGLFASQAAVAQSVQMQPGETQLVIYNASNADTTCMVTGTGTAGAQDGCPSSPFSLRSRDITINGALQPLVPFGASGWFKLPRGHRVQLVNIGVNPYTNQRSACFQGMVIGFGQFGNSCPDAIVSSGSPGNTQFPNTKPGPLYNTPASPPIPLPNGSNAFEPTLNVPGTIGGVLGTAATSETMDISCVVGANSLINVSLIPPTGGPYWTTDLGPKGGGTKTYTSVTSFQNSWVDFAKHCDDNCVDPKTRIARPGVFPFGCSQCNMLPDPAPQCGLSSVLQFCAAQNGLQVQGAPVNTGTGCLYSRKPKQVQGAIAYGKFGGTVQVNYLGPLSPPLVPPKATCH